LSDSNSNRTGHAMIEVSVSHFEGYSSQNVHVLASTTLKRTQL
jgi:hypothetical protein